jgi:hypothetical protein
MPVTRSSSLLASRNATQPLDARNDSRQEVIVLSDRDDEPSGTRHLSRKATRRRRPKAKDKPAFVLGDVLEISSDDEPSPSSTTPPKQSKQSSTLSKLQAQIQILQKVCRRIHVPTRAHESSIGERRAQRGMQLAEREGETPARTSHLVPRIAPTV